MGEIKAQCLAKAERQLPKIAPISGWALHYIIALDAHWPGVAGGYFRASDERRQVIAALLATKSWPMVESDAAALAEFIARASHRAILTEAYGFVPLGLRGALARSGSQPHSDRFYRTLFQLMARRADPGMAAVIQQLDNIDLTKLRIAQSLPSDIRTANLVMITDTIRMASDIRKLVDLLSNNGICREALGGALRRVSSAKQLSDFWARWSEKLTFPLHPVPASDFYKPIMDGSTLRRLALRYRNCARGYLAEVMQGESAFAEILLSGRHAVAHLRRRNEVWTLEGIFGRDNAMAAPELRAPALSYLSEQGVVPTERPKDLAGEWAVLRRNTQLHFFGF